MKAGFGRADITPRLGVELSGFGPYIHRYARELRDHLYARALAASDGSRTWVLVSADLLGHDASTVAETRRIVSEVTELEPECVMIHATHTHSGPAVSRCFTGWGEPDAPYLERLPALLAGAACQALEGLRDAEFACAQVPAEGIGYNRELDTRPAFEDALRDNWRPTRPELTDTTAHVVCVRAGGELVGFVSFFSCHPVVCCEATHSIHGDYSGVATNCVEKEHPGTVGIFLQGALGDTNACICHMPQAESMHGLNVIAGRYARSIRRGIAEAKPLDGSSVASALHRVTFRRNCPTREELESDMRKQLELIRNDPEGDAGGRCRMATVRLKAGRKLLRALDAGESLEKPTDMQALRLGDMVILGTPFELFRGIKERILGEIEQRPLLVLSTTNDQLGYAPTKETYLRKDEGRGSYARETVPLILGTAPFTAGLEDEIVSACVRLVEEIEGAAPSDALPTSS